MNYGGDGFMPRALITGAGPAGTAAAIALGKAGWEPVIYEAYDHPAGLEQGVFLTLAVNGLDALGAVDADGPIRELGFPTGKIRFFSGTGKSLGAMAIGPVLADGTVTRSLRRADLYGALYDLAVRRGVRIEHGRRLVSAAASPGGVTARFADGTSASGDVLIGADGLRSTVRALIDPAAPAPRYTGMGNVGGFTRTPGVEPDGGDYRMIWGKRCFFGYTVSPDGEVWWFANPPSRRELSAAELRAARSDQLRARLVSLLELDNGPAARIVGSTMSGILLGNQYDIPSIPTWHGDRMVVIGDAAHAVSPSTGQGVSQAFEDAVVLAQCLRDSGDVATALVAYERLRRGRVEAIAAWGAKMGGTKTAGPAMRVVRDLVLPHILAKGATPEAMDKQAWMFSHHIQWDRTGETTAAR
jgi:FAD-dependent urate hydroxylase